MFISFLLILLQFFCWKLSNYLIPPFKIAWISFVLRKDAVRWGGGHLLAFPISNFQFDILIESTHSNGFLNLQRLRERAFCRLIFWFLQIICSCIEKLDYRNICLKCKRPINLVQCQWYLLWNCRHFHSCNYKINIKHAESSFNEFSIYSKSYISFRR